MQTLKIISDRKKKGERRNNYSQLGGAPQSTTNKQPPQAASGLTMQSLHGELNKQMSLPTFKSFN